MSNSSQIPRARPPHAESELGFPPPPWALRPLHHLPRHSRLCDPKPSNRRRGGRRGGFFVAETVGVGF